MIALLTTLKRTAFSMLSSATFRVRPNEPQGRHTLTLKNVTPILASGRHDQPRPDALCGRLGADGTGRPARWYRGANHSGDVKRANRARCRPMRIAYCSQLLTVRAKLIDNVFDHIVNVT
jgi:hypothetical protein